MCISNLSRILASRKVVLANWNRDRLVPRSPQLLLQLGPRAAARLVPVDAVGVGRAALAAADDERVSVGDRVGVEQGLREGATWSKTYVRRKLELIA